MTGIRYIIFINVGRSRPLVEAVQGDYTVENRMPVACNFAYNLIIFKIWDTEPLRRCIHPGNKKQSDQITNNLTANH